MQAGRELEIMAGVTAGIANAVSGKESNAVRTSIANMYKRAFPQRYD